jgi:uncharacterized protein with HEPN domain
MRNVRERLADILDAIERIESQKLRGKEAFATDPLLQVWMIHHLMIVGEAVRAIDPSFKQKHTSVPWRQIAGMRNLLVHDYFRINEVVVWETVERDIPLLKAEIEALIENFPPE